MAPQQQDVTAKTAARWAADQGLYWTGDLEPVNRLRRALGLPTWRLVFSAPAAGPQLSLFGEG